MAKRLVFLCLTACARMSDGMSDGAWHADAPQATGLDIEATIDDVKFSVDGAAFTFEETIVPSDAPAVTLSMTGTFVDGAPEERQYVAANECRGMAPTFSDARLGLTIEHLWTTDVATGVRTEVPQYEHLAGSPFFFIAYPHFPDELLMAKRTIAYRAGEKLEIAEPICGFPLVLVR
jgi:hypothetical protein